MAIVEFFEFISIPVNFFKIIGQAILESPKKHNQRVKFLKIVLLAVIVNYTLQWGSQATMFILALRSSDFLAAYSVAPCAGFGLVGYMKLITLNMNKSPIEEVLQKFKDIYPKTFELQEDYQLTKHLRTLKPVMKFYAALNVFNAIYFPLIAASTSLYAVVFNGVKYDFPVIYPMWYPFNPSQNWTIYLLTTSTLFYAGFSAAIAYSTADLFLVSSLAQLCMHFEFISKELDRFRPSSSEYLNDKFLRRIVKHHIKCLKLNNSLDTIFGYSLLLNFLASSGTICFVGFQVLSTSIEELLQNVVLLITSLVQVLIICIYGNKVIVSSEAVGTAAFGHPWFMCNLKYRKMVLLMIARSQKFAAIHAPTFPPISLQTFMKVISMSYQFFAVLQTTSA